MRDRTRFSRKIFLAPKLRKWNKNVPKNGFFEYIEKFCDYVLLNLFYNENLYYLLCSWTDPIFGKTLVPEISAKMFSANQIAGCFNRTYLQNKSMKQSDFFYSDKNSHKLKLIKKILDGRDQKWVWPVWSRDSKIGCIPRMNWRNQLIFCMTVQIQERKKLFQWFLGGPGQKWAWSSGSWDPKIYWISLWIEMVFCTLTVIQ